MVSSLERESERDQTKKNKINIPRPNPPFLIKKLNSIFFLLFCYESFFDIFHFD